MVLYNLEADEMFEKHAISEAYGYLGEKVEAMYQVKSIVTCLLYFDRKRLSVFAIHHH